MHPHVIFFSNRSSDRTNHPIDIEGHAEDQGVGKALAALKKRASLFRVLGSYPRAVL